MARIQQSVDINVAAHAVYTLLTQFEEYPRFMPNVEAVQRIDDAHFHWSKKIAERHLEWDTEITEQLPDRRITWHNLNGPRNDGEIDLQTVGPEQARVTVTMECEPSQLFSREEDNTEAAMTQRLAHDLTRFKDFAEASAGSMPASGYAAGSEGGDVSADSEQEAERFSVAEELNVDQQSDQARRVGQMPQAAAPGEMTPSDAMAESMRQQQSDAKGKADLQQSIERAVPPSDH